MKRRGAKTGEAIAPSLFRSYFNNVIFIAILPFALTYTLVRHPLPESQALAFIIPSVFVVLFAAVITAAVFSSWLHKTLLLPVSRAWRFLTKHDIEKTLRNFEVTFSHGLDRIRQNPRRVLVVIGAILGSWLFTAVVLGDSANKRFDFAVFVPLNINSPVFIRCFIWGKARRPLNS